MDASRHELLKVAARGLLSSARFSQALTIASVGAAYLAFALRQTIGWAGMIGILAGLVALAASSITLKRRELEWRGILPISLLVFLGWSALSVAWSYYSWSTLGSALYQLAFAALGVYVSLTRDLIQIVRAFGDVLRVVLTVSLVLEILAGLLLDLPIAFLDIDGALDDGGPIQGILGSRNQLGLVALIALITFYVELQTRSLRRDLAIGSLVGAALIILLSGSPVSFGAFAAVAVATVVLIGLRRMDAPRRRIAQFILLAALVVGLVVLFIARSRVIGLLNAGSEFGYRYSLWQDILSFTPIATLEGFGWLGYWREGLPPYIGIGVFTGPHSSALNAFLDVQLQLGVVGLFSFIALIGLAMVRSWLLAANKRSVVFLWPALVLVALVVTSAAESSVLVEFGWLTLVICAIKASQYLSWRSRLPVG